MTGWKKWLSIVAAGALAQAALAAGEHAGGHGKMDKKGHDMSGQRMSGGHASAAGQPGKAAQATRTIDVAMGESGEFIFTPERIEVKAGETVRFRLRNAGKLAHEFVLGDAAELQAHAKMMRDMPTMVHKEANMVSVEAGKAGELVWTFGKGGEFEYACLVPGHYEAGMLGKVRVQ